MGNAGTPNPQRLKDSALDYRSHTADAAAQPLPQDGAARAAMVDALAGLCGQPAAIVEAGIAAFLRQAARAAA